MMSNAEELDTFQPVQVLQLLPVEVQCSHPNKSRAISSLKNLIELAEVSTPFLAMAGFRH